MEESVLSRVTSEKQALDANLSKLAEFLAKEGTIELVGDVQFKLLKRQKNAMENYSDILSSRIGDLHTAEATILNETFDVPESDLVEDIPELKLAENPKVESTKVDWKVLEDVTPIEDSKDPEELK